MFDLPSEFRCLPLVLAVFVLAPTAAWSDQSAGANSASTGTPSKIDEAQMGAQL